MWEAEDESFPFTTLAAECDLVQINFICCGSLTPFKGSDVTFQSAIYPSSQVLFGVLIELIFIF